MKDEERFGRQGRKKKYSGLREYCQEERRQSRGLRKEQQVIRVSGCLQLSSWRWSRHGGEGPGLEGSCVSCKKSGLYSAGNGKPLVSFKLGDMTKLLAVM